MQRVIIEISTRSVYLDTPRGILKRGLDYAYRQGYLRLYAHGFDCVPRSVAGARRARRAVKSGRVPLCDSGVSLASMTDVECDAVLDSGRPPSPLEVLLLAYSARLYRLIEEGKLGVSSIARHYSTGSCSLIEGGYLWHMLEKLFGRRALRLSASRLLTSDCRHVHVALVPVYKGGRLSVRESRCYIGVSKCRAVYEVILPEELEPNEDLRLLGEAQEEARRRLAEILEVPYSRGGGAVRMGAGVWPLSSIPAVALLTGHAIGEALETIFAAYRRCGGPRLWPPRRLEYLLLPGGKLDEPGLLATRIIEKS